jgi:hypothetical protein
VVRRRDLRRGGTAGLSGAAAGGRAALTPRPPGHPPGWRRLRHHEDPRHRRTSRAEHGLIMGRWYPFSPVWSRSRPALLDRWDQTAAEPDREGGSRSRELHEEVMVGSLCRQWPGCGR